MKNFYKNFTNKIESNNVTNSSLKKKVLKRVGQAGVSLVSVALAVEAAKAIDTTQAAKDVIGSEGGKEALNEVLKVARSTPALSVAAGITCVACIPIAGVAASPGLCIACGILIAKTLG